MAPDKFNGKVLSKVVEGDREAEQRGMLFVSWRGDAVVLTHYRCDPWSDGEQ